MIPRTAWRRKTLPLALASYFFSFPFIFFFPVLKDLVRWRLMGLKRSVRKVGDLMRLSRKTSLTLPFALPVAPVGRKQLTFVIPRKKRLRLVQIARVLHPLLISLDHYQPDLMLSLVKTVRKTSGSHSKRQQLRQFEPVGQKLKTIRTKIQLEFQFGLLGLSQLVR